MLLEVKNLTVCYATAMLLNDLSLGVKEGELVSLVGPNGAGKSTLLRTISGLVRWEKATMRGARAGDITIEGTVHFAEERIDRLAAHEIVRRGLIHCPERSRPFPEMSVTDNLKAGGYLCNDGGEVQRRLEMVYQLLIYPATLHDPKSSKFPVYTMFRLNKLIILNVDHPLQVFPPSVHIRPPASSSYSVG